MSITRGNFEKDMMGRFDFSLIPEIDGEGRHGWVSQYVHQATRDAARAWIAGMKRGQQIQSQPEKDQGEVLKALHDLAFSIRYTPQGLPALHALRQADDVLATYANQPVPGAKPVLDDLPDTGQHIQDGYDARRYRWLRSKVGLHDLSDGAMEFSLPRLIASRDEARHGNDFAFDAAIDRAVPPPLLSAPLSDKIIRDTDFSIYTFRKAGGFVTSPDVGVRILHVPTGLTAERSDAHSQHKNRSDAMAYLRSRLIEQGWKDPAYEPNPHNHIIKDAGD